MSTQAGESTDAAVPTPRAQGESTDPDAATPDAADTTKQASTKWQAVRDRLPDRRQALFLIGGAVAGLGVGSAATAISGHTPSPPPRDDTAVLDALAARQLLQSGNARFVSGALLHPDQSLDRRTAVSAGQHPFAIVLSCADSRVPPEVLFDQGLGDLFTVRSAGQVVDDAVLGSLEYAVQHLGPPLLVVLGHSGCGAVKAAVETHQAAADSAAATANADPSSAPETGTGTGTDASTHGSAAGDPSEHSSATPTAGAAPTATSSAPSLVAPDDGASSGSGTSLLAPAQLANVPANTDPGAEAEVSDGVQSLIDAILPAVQEAERVGASAAELLPVSVDINVERVVERLKGSPVIGRAALLRKVKVVGATYSLESGVVNWL